MPANYTANYALNQWNADDKVQRTDFNADNAKIDAAIKQVDTKANGKASQSALNNEISARSSAVTSLNNQVNTINATLAKKGNCQIYYTSYTGDGATTKTLTFPKKPLAVFIMGSGTFLKAMYGYELVLASNHGSAGTVSDAVWSGNTLTWTYRNGTYTSDICNGPGATYYVVALMDAST